MNEVEQFIAHAREKGMDHATIRALLVSSGWKERDVVEALAQTTLDLPVPRPPERGGAGDAFLQLAVTSSFYTGIVALTMILFMGIDRLLPDAAEPESMDEFRRGTVRWSLAYLIIAFPLFLFFSSKQLAAVRRHPEAAWSVVRRVLTFLTLFFAGAALAIDLIVLLHHVLEGELTTRFLLKVGVVLALAALTFSYFLFTVRAPQLDARGVKLRRAFLAASVAAACGTIAWGLAISGTPAAERARRVDERRIDDLRNIREEITRLCLGTTRHEAQRGRRIEEPLPANLEALRKRARNRRPRITDPETGEPYGYEILSDSRFRIGARFDTARDEPWNAVWNHTAGQTWFEFDLLTD